MDAREFAMNENVMVDVADCITSQLPIAGQDDFGAGQAFQNYFLLLWVRDLRNGTYRQALIRRNFGQILSWFSFRQPGYASRPQVMANK